MIIYYFLIATLGTVIKICWLGKIEGVENVPKKGRILLAPNHEGWLDPFLLGYVVPRRLYFLVGEFVYKSKLGAWCVNQMEFIRVDRHQQDKSYVYDEVNRYLGKSRAVVVFPEGRMTRDGNLQRAYKGVARMALATQTDIVPVAMSSYHIYSVNHKRPRFKNARANIKFLEPLHYESFKHLDPGVIVHDMIMPAIAKELGKEYPASFEEKV